MWWVPSQAPGQVGQVVPKFLEEGFQYVGAAALPHVGQGHGCPTMAPVGKVHPSMPGVTHGEGPCHLFP